MLINEKTSKELDVLYGQFFNLNSLFDNAVSYMLNEWGMVNASEIIHLNLAHLFPVLADKVSEIKDDFDERSVRPTVPEHKEEYKNLVDLFDRLLDECEATYNMIKIVNDTSISNGDLNVHVGLISLTQNFNKVIGQVITLNNKAHQLIDNFDLFDAHIEHWGIKGL